MPNGDVVEYKENRGERSTREHNLLRSRLRSGKKDLTRETIFRAREGGRGRDNSEIEMKNKVVCVCVCAGKRCKGGVQR